MLILGVNGINGLFHDASASIIADGKIITSVEEERFNRQKHSNGVPFNAIDFCLKKAGAKASDIDHIGYYLDPAVLKQTLVDDVIREFGCPQKKLDYYNRAVEAIANIRHTLAGQLGLSPKAQLHFINHHLVHAASAFYISGFDEAAVLTIDGSGDRETSTLYHGRGSTLTKVADFLVYPRSLGFIYTVFANHVGFDWIGGPGKMMGLAGFGTPDPSLFDGVITLRDDPKRPIDIDLSFFEYHLGGSGFTAKGRERFGEPWPQGAAATQKQKDLAATAQLMLERAIMHLVGMVPRLLPGVKNLCFAGGVALNVCTNRRIVDSRLFEQLFVPPAASDAGTSLGCALQLDAQLAGRGQHEFDVYLGPDIARDYAIEPALRGFGDKVRWEKLDEDSLCRTAGEHIAANKIIGWAQGRMECGPRALGNRSILTNAANPHAKDELNLRVKKREHFRPYAPSVLREHCSDWFDLSHSPHMLLEARVLANKASKVAGIVHVDGTSRPQTVTPFTNSRYYKLISAVYEKIGVPMVLNTSFNLHGEPIVNTPEEAVRDLLETDLDALFVGDYHITKPAAPSRSRQKKASRETATT